MPKLTRADLEQTLTDERHGGWGYATRRSLTDAQVATLNSALVSVANDLGLNYEGLFLFTNSRPGRHLVDVVPGSRITKALVQRYLSASLILTMAEEEGGQPSDYFRTEYDAQQATYQAARNG